MNVHISTKQAIILLAALNVLALIGYIYAYKKLDEKNALITTINRQVETFAATDANLEVLQAALASAEEEVKLVDSFYVPTDGAADFLERMEMLARENNLSPQVDSIDSLDVSKETKNLQERLTLRLSADGDWSDIYDFLLLAENLPYRISLDGVNIDLLDRTPGAVKPVWRGSFEISVLKLK